MAAPWVNESPLRRRERFFREYDSRYRVREELERFFDEYDSRCRPTEIGHPIDNDVSSMGHNDRRGTTDDTDHSDEVQAVDYAPGSPLFMGRNDRRGTTDDTDHSDEVQAVDYAPGSPLFMGRNDRRGTTDDTDHSDEVQAVDYASGSPLFMSRNDSRDVTDDTSDSDEVQLLDYALGSPLSMGHNDSRDATDDTGDSDEVQVVDYAPGSPTTGDGTIRVYEYYTDENHIVGPSNAASGYVMSGGAVTTTGASHQSNYLSLPPDDNYVFNPLHELQNHVIPTTAWKKWPYKTEGPQSSDDSLQSEYSDEDEVYESQEEEHIVEASTTVPTVVLPTVQNTVNSPVTENSGSTTVPTVVPPTVENTANPPAVENLAPTTAPPAAENPTTGSEDSTLTDPSTRKKKRLTEATMEVPEDAATKKLTVDELRQIMHQPASVRKNFTLYFTKQGLIRKDYYDIAFQRNRDGELTLPDYVLRSNIANWVGKYANHRNPEAFNSEGNVRKRAMKLRKDQRGPTGTYIQRNELRDLTEYGRNEAVAHALAGKPIGRTALDEDEPFCPQSPAVQTDPEFERDEARQLLLLERTEHQRTCEKLRRAACKERQKAKNTEKKLREAEQENQALKNQAKKLALKIEKLKKKTQKMEKTKKTKKTEKTEKTEKTKKTKKTKKLRTSKS